MWTQQRDNATTRPGKISDKKYYIYIYKFEIEIDSENQQRPAQQQKQKAQKKIQEI